MNPGSPPISLDTPVHPNMAGGVRPSGQGSGAAPKESSHVAADVTPLSAGLPLHLQLARLSESRLKQLLPTLLEVRAVIQRAVIQRAYLGPFQLGAAGLGPSNRSKDEDTSQRPLSALIPQCGLLRNSKLRAVQLSVKGPEPWRSDVRISSALGRAVAELTNLALSCAENGMSEGSFSHPAAAHWP